MLGHEILAQQILVQTEDHRRVLIDAAEVLSVIRSDRNKGGSSGKHKGKEGKGKENKGRRSRGSSGKGQDGNLKNDQDGPPDKKN